MNKTHDFKLNMPDYSDAVDIDILNDNFRVIDDALMAGLCEKEYTGNNMGSSDPASRKYAWAPWFEIKNENDFDVQITDRNFETTITIEAGETYRKHIVGTYYMNFYVQDQHDVTFRWFCDAETRIKEIDPSGGGSVSSVNVTGASSSHIVTSGGPITSSGTIEIDLAEGYSIPQTNKQTSWDGKAADLKAEIDSSTYVLTLQLKDSAGNLIGNERTIDLPLETMVVDGEYDPQTQKIKLELKNGNYVEFSVADLVSGLQTELSASNKLDPDYIDYDASHRAVSDTEKDTWNGKQNAISDLETIRSGAAAGATAVQPSVMEDALDDKQDSIDGSHKLSSDLVDDTNKTNKFVTSAEKNTWNSKQNALTFDGAPTSGSNNPVKSGGIYTALSGKQDTIDSSHKLSSALVSFSTAQNAALSSGIDSTKVSQISTNQTNILSVEDMVCATEFSSSTAYAVGDMVTYEHKLYKFINAHQGAWSASDVQNYDLTRLEAEDRAALAEEIDAGAKNKWDFANCGNGNWHATTSKTNTSFTVTSTDTRAYFSMWQSLPAGHYVFSAKISNLSGSDYKGIAIRANSTSGADLGSVITFSANGTISGEFTCTATTTVYFVCYASMDSFTGTTTYTASDIMVCTKAAFGVSQKFVPYRGQVNPTAYIQPTKDEKITSIDWGGYIILPGNVCLFNIRCIVGTAIDAYGTLFTGLPKPIGNLASTSAALRCISNASEKINLRADGKIVAVDEPIPIGTLLLSGMYLCK